MNTQSERYSYKLLSVLENSEWAILNAKIYRAHFSLIVNTRSRQQIISIIVTEYVMMTFQLMLLLYTLKEASQATLVLSGMTIVDRDWHFISGISSGLALSKGLLCCDYISHCVTARKSELLWHCETMRHS